MKRVLLEVCFWINILVYLPVIVLLVEVLGNVQIISQLLSDSELFNYRMLLNIPILFLWIFNLVVWSTHDKKTKRLILIILLNGFYNPFYYRFALKNNWVK